MSDKSYLVLFDADRIKDFVFATGRLKEIRGGSQIVRDATDAEKLGPFLGIPPEQVIFAEGGSGLLKAAGADQAADFRRRLARRYRSLTHGATLTAVAELLDNDFKVAVGRAARGLRLAKEGRLIRQQHAQSPFTRPCDSCGARPAAKTYRRGNRPPEQLCEACNAKRAQADKLRRQSVRQDDDKDEYLLALSAWGQEFIASLPLNRRALLETARLPADLDDLAKLSRPDNYLGFLYADGNGLGDRVQQQTSEDDYRRFSRRVSFSLRAALWLALQEHFPSPRNEEAPFEIIALGGDDLILATVADKVVPLAITLGERFTQISAGLAGLAADQITLDAALAVGRHDGVERTAADEKEAFTLSFGIVIAHPGQPILSLEQRARELLRSAKAGFPGQAALDFHVVSSPVLRDLRDIRDEEYRVGDEDEAVYLTGRPLTLAQAASLLQHIISFKEGGEAEALPRNKLHALYAALFAGRDAATFETFFLRSRLNQRQDEKLRAFFKAFGIIEQPAESHAHALPWGRDARDRVFTVFSDLIELYEFTPAGPARGQEVSHDAAQG